MYIDSITFWTTVLSGIIIGLVVGGILGGIGYFIWKKQNNYTKRQDILNVFIPVLKSFCSTITLLKNMKNIVNDDLYVNYILNSNKQLTPFLNEKDKFLYFFDNKIYYNAIDEIIEIYSTLIENMEIKMNNDELKQYLFDRIDIFKNIKIK